MDLAHAFRTLDVDAIIDAIDRLFPEAVAKAVREHAAAGTLVELDRGRDRAAPARESPIPTSLLD